jgi:hypothetical protein
MSRLAPRRKNETLRLFELALVLVRLDHVASRIINANHSIVRAAVMLRAADCIADRIRPVVPQPTESQGIADEIDAAFVFAGANFAKVHPVAV